MSSALANDYVNQYRDRVVEIGAGLRQLGVLNSASSEFHKTDENTHTLILSLPDVIRQECERQYDKVMERFHVGYAFGNSNLVGQPIEGKCAEIHRKRSGLRFLVNKGGSQSSGRRVIARVYEKGMA